MIAVLWTAAAVMAGLALWALQRSAPAADAPGSALKAAAEEAEREAAGRAVPGFRVPTLEPYRDVWGDTIEYAEFVGSGPLVINFWASWCLPCRNEAPLLEAAWQKYGESVRFLGINFQDREADALAFLMEFGHTFPSGADPRGEAGRDFRLIGVPTTYFVDTRGTIRTVKVGEIDAAELESNVAGLLAVDAQ